MRNVHFRRLLAALLIVSALPAAEHKGTVKFGTVPIPGATVTAQQGERKANTLTDTQGNYIFSDLTEGTAKISIDMRGFASQEREVPVAEPGDWKLTLLPLTEITAAPAAAQVTVAESPQVTIKRPENTAAPAATNTTSGFQRTQVQASNTPVTATEVSSDVAQRAADGLLVNGSVNNAASSVFATLPAFGNNRAPNRWPYAGNAGLTMDNSSLDARPFSLTGQNTPRPGYNRTTAFITVGGPIRIPGLVKNGPQFTLSYSWTRNRSASTQTGIMPTALERLGDFSQSRTPGGDPVIVRDPATGLPIADNKVPLSRFSPQAVALLKFYPLPNFLDRGRYNYQVPIQTGQHTDSLQFRTNRTVAQKNNLVGTFQWQSTRTDTPNLFGFLANGRQMGLQSTAGWRHNFSTRHYINFGYQFSRSSSRTIPFFANRENVSGQAGITGNNQEPVNWGPPALNFANGISPLGEAQYGSTVNQSSGVTVDGFRALSRHNLTYGFDYRRQQTNIISQQDARGNFTFTGAAAGSDFAGFLFGIPDTSSIAYGNADKYFRSNAWATYISDDWRARSGLSVTLGLRWEYNSPITEKYGRLVNMAIGGNFQTATPVVGGRLLFPDKNNLAPRFGFAWRPLPASSMVVRGGYGVYFDNSLYQSIAMQMAQQAPLSNSLRVQNSPSNPLTLANGFKGSPDITATTFGIDPLFRSGYAQNWQVSVQRDLPFALQAVVTYLGIKGTRGVQQFLPNTYPSGTIDPCVTCPTGFSYMMSNGNSTRHAGTVQLRRRLRRGLTAEMSYTYAKAIDNAALAGSGFLIAQNWLDLRAERSRSNFDQRHVITGQFQYTTGATSGVGFLTTGKSGAFLREWTITSQFTFGTGTPLTPTFFSAVAGTGVTGNLRANVTGADFYAGTNGRALNPDAFAVPAPGTWGNAGRNIITGPSQFTMNASAGRTFRWGDRFNADLRIDASNVFNHPVFTSWNTVITSAQFGLLNPAGQMRTVQTSLRVRF
jgi:hypothetical protein